MKIVWLGLASWLVSLQAPSTIAPSMELGPGGGKANSALSIRPAQLPGEGFELVTCEAVMDGNLDLGLYAVAPKASDWKVEGDARSYTYALESGVELRFRAVGHADSVELEYTLRNGSKETLRRAHLHPCLPTVGSPSFYPGTAEEAAAGAGGRAARVGRKDFTSMWDRLWLWSKSAPFAFSSSNLAKQEKHLAFPKRNEDPIEWSWWKNAPETFELPLIALESKDGRRVLALGFERAIWASSNGGDPRACFHLFPYFGKLAPGASATVRGRLYLIDGSHQDARRRFLADFPKVDGG